MRLAVGVLTAWLAAAAAFAPTAPVASNMRLRGVSANSRKPDAMSLRMGIPKSSEPARKVPADSAEAADLKELLAPCGLWSVPPTMMTMHLDNPEKFMIVKGKVEIMPTTVTGQPLGPAVEFQSGDYGIVPGGSYRWTVLKQTTKKSKLDANEPIGLLGTKGWREEPAIKALQGVGTMSTQGLDAEDNLEYLKKLIADKGFIPERAWEEAIQSKLDRDIYLANLAFKITDKGIIVSDRIKETPLAVLTETAWEEFDPSVDYIETESSKRWRKDGSFRASVFMANKSVSEASGV